MRNLSLLGSEAAAGPVKGGPAGPSAASRAAASLTGSGRAELLNPCATPTSDPDSPTIMPGEPKRSVSVLVTSPIPRIGTKTQRLMSLIVRGPIGWAHGVVGTTCR